MPPTVMHRSTTSQLNLVDLAGSERVLRSGATGVALQVSCPFAIGLCVLGVGTAVAGVFTICTLVLAGVPVVASRRHGASIKACQRWATASTRSLRRRGPTFPTVTLD